MEKTGGSGLQEHTLEIISAILLSLTTIASAWSAYQATRWSGVQAVSFSQAASDRAEAGRLTNIADRKISVQVGLFVQYAAALSQNNQMLADFLFERFPPELKDATRKWLETKPLQNPDAPSSPFVMDDYSIPEIKQADSLLVRASEQFENAKESNQRGDNYVLLTVMFASVLFFAGVGTKFQDIKIKFIILGFGMLIFFTAVIILTTYPVH